MQCRSLRAGQASSGSGTVRSVHLQERPTGREREVRLHSQVRTGTATRPVLPRGVVSDREGDREAEHETGGSLLPR
ncbi:hypothetical protein SAMN05444392_10575 [Seinonella peptonophila]|uniref:Uncharacterized protein n=1 Tax=Seinonella peptonophila TaxID=112248 RepID=A0A1M4XMW3_9BACL|nr:hypothetical protein SAMN05444392_10575 [Seinonella peptonophila]